jgi:hypothetical protein
MNGVDIKIERVRHGLRQYRVAAVLGITQSELCAVENGRKPISRERAHSIVQTVREMAAQEARERGDERAA